MGFPAYPTDSIIRLEEDIQYMPPRYGNGSQRDARKDRVRKEIVSFVRKNPGSSAQSIVAYLSIDMGLRNHGLTPRKVGFFIPRYCPEITWYQDHAAGRRVYAPLDSQYARNRAEKIHRYAEHRTGTNTPKPQVGMTRLAERASQSAVEMNAARVVANSSPTSTQVTSVSRAPRLARGTCDTAKNRRRLGAQS